MPPRKGALRRRGRQLAAPPPPLPSQPQAEQQNAASGLINPPDPPEIRRLQQEIRQLQRWQNYSILFLAALPLLMGGYTLFTSIFACLCLVNFAVAVFMGGW